ncbi:MAG: single-stranded DNA-binding protein [Alphaproteobacteria bacterium]|nr:single-stranded DNA-binding protein [Alphaproteobacteria bacterium]
MAGSVNKVILIGNLGRDPEVRNSQNGDKIVTLNLATSESWKDRQSGERKEKTEWHRVVIFNPNLADIAERYCKKGSKLYIEGALQTRKWTDKDGNEKYTTEVVIGRFKGEIGLLDGKGGGGGSASAGGDFDEDSYGQPSQPAASSGQGKAGGGGSAGWDRSPPGGDLDDEIPF